ncbi:type II toxin-antitoxin system Phd/YefM family antitoxin [Paracoccus sp. (in: a-proteobacteria)]|uniref:type II toxin-antitoxin system Phd/YefM family antitoxin n=1 Tax=Paracoccus sp. TaxID=267 RepID=UPI0026DF849C|nr:type II toxin-antitoxin system prevent-host-death family antitoxin [Paracoccus sp. (in: a-proteobacteria)]MDO5371310.1 type II toxin-antitoxin system prevent-host-death family antitoxin [Paracoccus sp. (in: a-proteobacteria)]
MQISLSDAKARLTDLVRQAEAGEEVVLTRHGKPAARIVPMAPAPSGFARARLVESLQRSAARSVRRGPEAARSQDFLYGDDGLPK